MYKNNKYANYNDNNIVEHFFFNSNILTSQEQEYKGLVDLSANNIVNNFWPNLDLSILTPQAPKAPRELVDLSGNNNIVNNFWLNSNILTSQEYQAPQVSQKIVEKFSANSNIDAPQVSQLYKPFETSQIYQAYKKILASQEYQAPQASQKIVEKFSPNLSIQASQSSQASQASRKDDNNIVEHFWPFDSKGDIGPIGNTGPIGPQGEQGPKGDKEDDLRNIQLDNFTLKFNNATVDWDKLDIKPTSLYGEGCTVANETTGTKYLTMKNMTLQNPIVVPKTVGGDASIKFGKAGGVATGTWWDTRVKTNGDFQILREDNIDNGGILLKSDGGIHIGRQMSQEMLKKSAEQKAEMIAKDITFIDNDNLDINITAMTKTFSLPVLRNGVTDIEKQDIMGNVNIGSPLNVFNDRGIMWLNTGISTANRTNGLAIAPMSPSGTGIGSVGTDENQAISIIPKGTTQNGHNGSNGNVFIHGNLTTTENMYNVGMVSNIKPGTHMTYSDQSFGPCWNIDTTDWFEKNALLPHFNAQLNIHHLIIWDTLTGSSYFAVVGFTASTPTIPPDLVFLSSATKNKGVLINPSFGYNALNKPFIYVTDVPENNILFYRIS